MPIPFRTLVPLATLFAATCLMTAPMSARAQAVPPPHPAMPGADVSATEVWSRATPPGANVAAAYLTLVSRRGARLVSASSPAAATVEVHEMRMDGDVMRMREMAGGLALPPGQAVTLRPGGLHLMMMGLKGPLKAGDTVSLHLMFESGPPLDVVATVGGVGATAAPGHSGH